MTRQQRQLEKRAAREREAAEYKAYQQEKLKYLRDQGIRCEPTENAEQFRCTGNNGITFLTVFYATKTKNKIAYSVEGSDKHSISFSIESFARICNTKNSISLKDAQAKQVRTFLNRYEISHSASQVQGMELCFAEDGTVYALDLFPVTKKYYRIRTETTDWQTVDREAFVAMCKGGEMPEMIRSAPGTTIPFGKHSGKSVIRVHQEDPKYLVWLLKQDIRPKLRKHIEEVLNLEEEA